LKKLVFDFKETMPIVEALGNKNLKDEHWNEIKVIINTEYELEKKEFKLGKLIEFNVSDH
jgi:dynein heavy chain